MKTIHRRCAGLDVQKSEVLACLRVVGRGKGNHEVRRFPTTTQGLFELAEWLKGSGCTHVAMEATGGYWKAVRHVLKGQFKLLVARAGHVKGVPPRKSGKNEATWIADLLAHFLIRASFGANGTVLVTLPSVRTARPLHNSGHRSNQLC
jgi:transposase